MKTVQSHFLLFQNSNYFHTKSSYIRNIFLRISFCSMQQFGVAVKALIKNERGEYLILKKSSIEDINPNTYDLPGGRIEFGEKPEDAILREVKEETGLNVEVVRIFNCWTFVKDDNFQLVGIDFICNLLGGDVLLSKEHDEIIWISESNLSTVDLPKWLIKTIDKAENCC